MSGDLAVVTGAARGMGAAVARRLAGGGWSLLLVDACAPQPPLDYPMPTPLDLDAVARNCRDAGAGTVDRLIADVGDGAVRGKIAAALGGRVPKAAVAVAGVIDGHNAWNAPDDAFDLLLRVNLYGVRHLADACVPPMAAAGTGRFVAVSSAAALRRDAGKPAAQLGCEGRRAGERGAPARPGLGSGVTANVVCPDRPAVRCSRPARPSTTCPRRTRSPARRCCAASLSRTRWPPRSPGSARRTRAL